MLKKNLKKIDIVNNLKNLTGLPSNFSDKLIKDLIQIIIENIKKDNFILKNVGNFKLIHKNERLGRNPKTKEKFIISSRKSVSFTPSKKILEKLNKLT